MKRAILRIDRGASKPCRPCYVFPHDPPAALESPPERNIYTVSRLNREVRLLLERGMARVWVEGELSNFRSPPPATGISPSRTATPSCAARCSGTRNIAGSASRRATGQQVVARGRVTLYEPRGDFQLIVEQLEEAGARCAET